MVDWAKKNGMEGTNGNKLVNRGFLAIFQVKRFQKRFKFNIFVVFEISPVFFPILLVVLK